MNCPRCAKALPPGAAFCMHCGQPIAAAPGPAGAPLPAPATGKKTTLWAFLIAALMLIAVLGGLFASGALTLGSKQRTGGELTASGSTPGGGLQAEGSTPGGNLGAMGTAPDPGLSSERGKRIMPDDVRRWLEHLERIERLREEVSTDNLSAAIQMMTSLQLGDTLGNIEALLNAEESGTEPQSPAQTTRIDIESMERKWVDLENDYFSLRAPLECQPLANRYATVLQETRGMILDIVKQIDRSTEDRQGALNALMGMRGKSGSRIGGPARDSDTMLYEICNKYDTRKWFSIRADFQSGLMGKMGF